MHFFHTEFDVPFAYLLRCEPRTLVGDESGTTMRTMCVATHQDSSNSVAHMCYNAPPLARQSADGNRISWLAQLAAELPPNVGHSALQLGEKLRLLHIQAARQGPLVIAEQTVVGVVAQKAQA